MTLRPALLASIAAIALSACATPPAPEPQALAPAAETVRKTTGTIVTENIPDAPPSLVERMERYENVRSHGFQDWTGEGGNVTSSSYNA